MKKILLLSLSLFIQTEIFSQSLSPEIIGTSGDYFSNSAGKLSWTIGECMTETYSASGSKLTQGFHQNVYTTTSIKEAMDEKYLISVFPNPASDFVSIKAESKDSKKLKAELLDLSGKIIYSEFFQNNTRLNLAAYASNIYFIRISDESGSFNIYKLQKIN